MMNPTILRAYQRWLEEAEPPKSPRTVAAYVGHVRAMMPLMGDAWTRPTAAEEKMRQWREAVGKAKREGQISASQIRTKLAAFRSFYHFLVAQQLVASNPAANIPNYPRDSGVPRPMPLEEVEMLLRALPVTAQSHASALRDRAMIECFLNGLRNVEVTRLNIGDVQYDGALGTLMLRVVGKGMAVGTVPLSPNAASFVARWILQSHVFEWQTLLTPNDGPPVQQLFRAFARWRQRNDGLWERPVFFKHVSTRLTRQDVNAMFREHRDAAGISRCYGPHSLRHTCATQLLNRGTDLRVVQSIMRHKNIAQTCAYAAVANETQAKAAQTLPTIGAAI